MSTKLHAICCLTLLAVVAMVGVGCSSTSSVKNNTENAQQTGDPHIDGILETAHEMLGTPYCWSGTGPDCFDCSGFVTFCFAASGTTTLPRTSRDLFTIGTSVDKSSLLPGDLVFFRTSGKSISHVGIVVGDGRFIHASTSKGVMISPLSDAYWAPRYVGAKRVKPGDD